MKIQIVLDKTENYILANFQVKLNNKVFPHVTNVNDEIYQIFFFLFLNLYDAAYARHVI